MLWGVIAFYILLYNKENCKTKVQDASVNRAILQHFFFSGSATLGRMPLSPFCCQL